MKKNYKYIVKYLTRVERVEIFDEFKYVNPHDGKEYIYYFYGDKAGIIYPYSSHYVFDSKEEATKSLIKDFNQEIRIQENELKQTVKRLTKSIKSLQKQAARLEK